MVPPRFVIILLLLFHNYFYAVYAFSFWFRSLPTQCENLTIEWTGGTAPFTLLLVPTGHITPETRTIIERHISSGNSISLTINYPSQSQFVAVLSDATGIGTGGTSPVTTVQPSSNSNCLSYTSSSPKFHFYLPEAINQCDQVDISWQSNAEGFVDILGLIPGGQSTEIACVLDHSTSYAWTANIRLGTDMLFVVGDNDGLGSGGSSDIVNIGNGTSDCINNGSPSSTLTHAAGSVLLSTSQIGQDNGFISESSTSATGQVTSYNSLLTTITDGPGGRFTPFLISLSSGSSSSDSQGTKPNQITSSSFSGSGGGTVTGPSERGSDGHKLPLILGLVLGTLALIGLLVVGLLCYRRKQRVDSYRNIDQDAGNYNQSRTTPMFGTRIRRGISHSTETLPSMYQTEPFVSPFEYMPPDIHKTASNPQNHRPNLLSRTSSTRSLNSYFLEPPLSREAFGTGFIGIHGSDQKFAPKDSSPSHMPSKFIKNPQDSFRLSSTLLNQTTYGSNYFYPTSITPLNDSVVEIPPSYASVRHLSMSGDNDIRFSESEGAKLTRSNAIYRRSKKPKRPRFWKHKSNETS